MVLSWWSWTRWGGIELGPVVEDEDLQAGDTRPVLLEAPLEQGEQLVEEEEQSTRRTRPWERRQRLDGKSVSKVIVVSIVLHVVKYPEQHLKQIFPPMSFKLISISIQYLKYTQNSVYVKITSWQHQRAQCRKVQKRCGTRPEIRKILIMNLFRFNLLWFKSYGHVQES